MKIHIYYQRTQKLNNLCYQLGRDLSIKSGNKPDIAFIDSLKWNINEHDNYISATGPGHNNSSAARSMAAIIRRSSAPGLVLVKSPFNGWVGRKLSLIGINPDKSLIYLPKKGSEEKLKVFLKRKNKKFNLKKWNKNGENIVFCMQNGRPHFFYSFNKTNYYYWVFKTIKKLVNNNKRQVILRLHPKRKFADLEFEKKISSIRGVITSKTDVSLEEELKSAYCMVTYNSSAAIKSIFMGTPVFTEASYFTEGVGAIGLDHLGKRLFPKRDKWLKRAAAASWAKKDFFNGNTAEFILKNGYLKRK